MTPADKETVLKQKQQVHREAIYQNARMLVMHGYHVVPVSAANKGLLSNTDGYSGGYDSGARTRKKAEEWFNPVNGKFTGANLGVATGDSAGIFIVDLDAEDKDKGKGDGIGLWVEWEMEARKLGEPSVPFTPKATTQNGGIHFVFQYDERLANRGILKLGIDIKSSSEPLKNGGMVIVQPSRYGDKTYKWEVSPDVADPARLPEFYVNKLIEAGYGSSTNRTPASKGAGRGNENIEDRDVEELIPLNQVARMLEAINPDTLSYDEWLRIGQSIHSQYETDEGLSVWDGWSSKGKRYQHDECNKRWRGFKSEGNVRINTLFYFAKAADWKPQKEDVVKSNDYLDFIERFNSKFAFVVVGNKTRIICEKQPGNYDARIQKRYDLLSVFDFKALTGTEDAVLVTVPDPKREGDMKSTYRGAADVWLNSKLRRQYVNGMAMHPDGDAPQGVYNTWNGFAVEPIKGCCKLFLSHLLNGVCNGDQEHYEWLLDWSADAIQDPANPKGCAIVMRGEEGTGKGTFANTIGDMFGVHHKHLIDDSHLTSNFNAHMMDAVSVFADEITWGGNKKSSGKLKGLVTEEHLMGEQKGIDAIKYKNMVHLTIASNSDWVIPAGPGSRRWFVLDVSEEHKGETKYFDAIYRELSNGGREAFMHEMQNRVITNDLRCAPHTEALQDQRALSNMTHLHHFLLDQIKVGRCHGIYEGMAYWTANDLFVDYERWLARRGINANFKGGTDRVFLGSNALIKEVLKIMNGGKGKPLMRNAQIRHEGGRPRVKILAEHRHMLSHLCNICSMVDFEGSDVCTWYAQSKPEYRGTP